MDHDINKIGQVVGSLQVGSELFSSLLPQQMWLPKIAFLSGFANDALWMGQNIMTWKQQNRSLRRKSLTQMGLMLADYVDLAASTSLTLPLQTFMALSAMRGVLNTSRTLSAPVLRPQGYQSALLSGIGGLFHTYRSHRSSIVQGHDEGSSFSLHFGHNLFGQRRTHPLLQQTHDKLKRIEPIVSETHLGLLHGSSSSLPSGLHLKSSGLIGIHKDLVRPIKQGQIAPERKLNATLVAIHEMSHFVDRKSFPDRERFEGESHDLHFHNINQSLHKRALGMGLLSSEELSKLQEVNQLLHRLGRDYEMVSMEQELSRSVGRILSSSHLEQLSKTPLPSLPEPLRRSLSEEDMEEFYGTKVMN